MSVLANDVFTDTDGVTATDHVPTNGVAWVGTVTTGADFVIGTNRLRGSAGGYVTRQDRLDKGTAYPNDYAVVADLVFKTATDDDYIYIGARSPVSGTGGYYFGYETHSIDGRRFHLLKGNGKAGTSLGSYAYAFPAADTVVQTQLIVEGTTITCKVAGSTVITVTDSTYTDGYPTVYFVGANAPSNSTSVHFDNFSVSASVTADVVIYVSSDLAGAVSGFRLSGNARVGPGVPDAPSISWVSADILFTATEGEINQAVATAAINACVTQGYAIGALDNKIIIGGSVGVM